MEATLVARIAAGSALALAALVALAQGRPPTTEQLGKDPGALRQEAEQQRAFEQSQQQQRSQQAADQQWNDTLRQQQSRDNANMAQARAVRQSWEQRPALAPDRNPLLGRWDTHPPGQRSAAGVSPEMAQLANALLGGITGGICESMLGKGTVEFRPQGVVAIGRDGREHALYRAEYRGGGARVVVLPTGGTTFRLAAGRRHASRRPDTRRGTSAARGRRGRSRRRRSARTRSCRGRASSRTCRR